MQAIVPNQPSKASIYSDIHSLNSLRKQARSDSHTAIKNAAKEFEAFFMNMMLKSMRQASAVIGDESMFSSEQEKMFVGMLDEQLSVDLSQKGNLGIADLLMRDLLKQSVKAEPNNDKNSQSKVSVKQSDKPKVVSSLLIESPNINTQSVAVKIERAPVPGKNSSVKQQHIVGEQPQSKLLTDLATLEPTASKKSLFDNVEDFITRLFPTAKVIAQDLGVDPKILLAQAALETGWGKYIMHDELGKASYNLFGIKDGSRWQGQSVNSNTLEVEQGVVVKRQDTFRMYENFEQSFQDYVDFVKSSPRYEQAIKSVQDAKQYVRSLQQSGYATDPDYAEKIIKIYESVIKPFELLK